MKVLVTGGAGFIGSHVVDRLRELGHTVVVLDVPSDVRSPDDWPLEGIDAVCHLAAKVGLGVDFADVTDYVSHNALGTAAGLLALHRSDFAGRLVIASSMVVYGEGRYRCQRDGVVRPGARDPADLDAGRFEPPCPDCGADLTWETVPEGAPVDPRNVYAATKLHQEHLVSVFTDAHPGTSAVALRYHNVYGPRMPRGTPYAGVASLFHDRVRSGLPPLVTEDGGQTRDFVHVRDVARATVLALTQPLPPGFVAVNVCSGQPRTILDLANALSAGAAAPIVTGAWRTGDVRHIVAAPELAKKVIDFEAEISLESGIHDVGLD